MSFLSNIFNKKAEANASVDFEVSLHCGKCVQRIENLLATDKAVANSIVSLGSKTVSIKYDSNKTTEDKLKKEIEGLGFEVKKK